VITSRSDPTSASARDLISSSSRDDDLEKRLRAVRGAGSSTSVSGFTTLRSDDEQFVKVLRLVREASSAVREAAPTTSGCGFDRFGK
jgi:hypothetical protein